MSVMSTNPTISLVTSLSLESAFIPQTIESVLAQDYSNVEHIVVDGMMTAATARLQSQYSHLKVIRAPSPGLAHAINAGFHAASGEIFGLLHADDTLEPGALRAVAEALAADGRHVVTGRCRLVGADGGYFGVECPSALESPRRLLEIWKDRWVTQRAVFWRRQAWETCGPLRVEAPASMLDYDLFCRFSRQYAFHRLDQVLASSRLFAQSPVISDEGRLEEAIAVSKRYWGRPFGIQYWQLLASYAAFKANRRSRAAGFMRSGRQLVRGREYGAGLGKILIGGALAPEVGLDVAAPVVKRAAASLRIQLNRQQRPRQPDTELWFGHTELHKDGWAGPTLEQELTLEEQHTTVALSGTVSVGHLRRPLELEAFLDGRPLGRSRVGQAGPFAVTWNLSGAQPGLHQLRIRANTFAVPHEYSGNLDYRPLSYRVVQLELGRRAQRPS
jgi:glycosyltransferase involved in cell wall biosynthesis